MIKCSRCFTEQSGPMICVSCANDLAGIGTKQVITLRQQRDELAEVCQDLISAWNSALSFDVAKTVGKARAALASIEGAE